MSKKPSDFTEHPWNSVKQSSEHETIARNIMLILERTGNKFRKLPWEEYKGERLKDGNFTQIEKGLFEEVKDFCISPDTAKLFSPKWSSDE